MEVLVTGTEQGRLADKAGGPFNRLGRPVRDKHSCLLQTLENCSLKSLITSTAGSNVIKRFVCNLKMFICYIVFVPGKPLEPSLMFVGKARSLP